MDLKTFKSMYRDGIIYEILNRLDKKLKMNNLLRERIERSLRDPELVKTLAGAWKLGLKYIVRTPNMGSYRRIYDTISYIGQEQDQLEFFIKMEFKEDGVIFPITYLSLYFDLVVDTIPYDSKSIEKNKGNAEEVYIKKMEEKYGIRFRNAL